MDRNRRLRNRRLRNRKRPFLFAALAVVLAAAAPTPIPVTATDVVLRCQAPDGSIGYTDKNCAVFDANPAPLPDTLVSRLAGEIETSGYDSYAAPAPGPRSPASGCARTPSQLAMDVRAALAMGDVNRLAASYHFAGMSSRAGEQTLDQLQTLIGHQAVAYKVQRYAGCYFMQF